MIEFMFIAVYEHKSIKQPILATDENEAVSKAIRLYRILPKRKLRSIKLVQTGGTANVG